MPIGKNVRKRRNIMNEYKIKINTKKESPIIENLKQKIQQEVIGQDRAIRRSLRAVASYYSGLKDPRRPIGGFIYAGPTGVGKTFAAKVSARHFLGGKHKYRDYLVRIDGSTLSERHEVAKLKGAPPGYIGYAETSILSQKNIDAYHFDVLNEDNGYWATKLKNFDQEKQAAFHAGSREQARKIQAYRLLEDAYEANKPYKSVILFDEIEKAHPAIWNVLLQIMEEGKIQMGKGVEETDFSNSLIILTTNIGQRSIQGLISKNTRVGFDTSQNITESELDKNIYESTKKQIEKEFPPELFKRLNLVVFRPLSEDNFKKILDNFLADEEELLNQRIKYFSARSIDIEYSKSAKKFLLKKGIDVHYGVRTLRSVVEKYVRASLANGLANREIRPGDSIWVDVKNSKLVFLRKYRKRGPNAIKRNPQQFQSNSNQAGFRLLNEKSEH